MLVDVLNISERCCSLEILPLTEKLPNKLKSSTDNVDVADVFSPSVPESKRFNTCWFILGVTECLYWNSLLNGIYDVVETYYPQYPAMSDTVSILFMGLNFIGAIGAAKRGFVNFRLNMCLAIGSSLLPVLTALSIHVTSGFTTVMLYHILAVFGGLVLAWFQAGHYGLAANMPGNELSYLAGGAGVSGIITFFSYVVFSEAVFPDASNVVGAIWGLGVSVCAFTLIGVVATWYLGRQPEVRAGFVQARALAVEARKNPNRPKLRQLMIEYWAPLLIVAVNQAQTFIIWPNIGPFRWFQDTATETNLLVGAFQIGECLGCAMPALGAWIPWVYWRPKVLYWATCMRFSILVPSLLIWLQSGVAFWNNFALQATLTFAIAFSGGWINSLGLIAGPVACQNDSAKGQLAALGLIALNLGICVGVLLTKTIAYCVEGTF